MSGENNTMSSNNAELLSEIVTIINLADAGYKFYISETKQNPDISITLFKVIKERLEGLESTILQQSDFKGSLNPSSFPQKSVTEQTLINREFESNVIHQRGDGYIDATAMCKATGKLFADYQRLKTTQEFIEALSLNMGIPIDQINQCLIESKSGGIEAGGGTWVHPHVAINLAQWCSPAFAVQVTSWVFELMTKGEVHLQSKPQLSKIHDLFPRTDAPIQSYIDECLERREAGEEIPRLNSRELVRKAIIEGCHTRRQISDYTGIKRVTVKKLIRRMLKSNEIHCVEVKDQSQVFLN